jgi:FMN phosphatase YigB (HAD superfamily)
MNRIFIDLDGVLADFTSFVKQTTGKTPLEFQNISDMWDILRTQEHVFDALDWMPEGKELWNSVRLNRPYILSAAPTDHTWETQKRIWVFDNLGLSADRVIISDINHSKIKAALEHLGVHSIPKDENWILIDDWQERNAPNWEINGGIFIHHTNIDTTLKSLLRILRSK